MPRPKRPDIAKRLARAATTVFHAEGFHRARVSDIADRAGVAKGTFYLYFRNKDEIFDHLIDDFFGRLLGQTLERYPSSAVADRAALAGQLSAMWHAILEQCRAEPVLTSLVLRDSPAAGPAARQRVERHFAATAQRVAAYFDDLRRRGILRAGLGAPTAWAVLGLIERAVHYAVVIAPDADPGPLVEEFLALELGGIAPETESPP